MEGTARTTDTQFVTLGIDREVFGVPVDAVLEILDMREMFRVPDAPHYVAGLMDVRGRSVPVIDLRARLGLPATLATDSTRILVMQVRMGGRGLVLGMVADRVFEVAPLDEGRLEPPPDIGTGWRSDHISGVGRRGERFVMVLDLGHLFAAAEETLLAA